MIDGVRNLRTDIAKARDGYVRPPYQGQPLEEAAAFRKAMGIPDAPEGYLPSIPVQIASDDAGKSRVGRFLKRLHAVGASSNIVQEAVNWFAEEKQAGDAEEDAAIQKEIDNGTAELRRIWGNDFTQNVKIAENALRYAFRGQLFDRVAELGLVRNPEVLRAFHQLGLEFREAIPMLETDPKAMVDQDAAITREFEERMVKGTHLEKDFQDRWAAHHARMALVEAERKRSSR